MPKTIEGETNTPIELEIKLIMPTYYYKVKVNIKKKVI